jgi:hypothetical protein
MHRWSSPLRIWRTPGQTAGDHHITPIRRVIATMTGRSLRIEVPSLVLDLTASALSFRLL